MSDSGQIPRGKEVLLLVDDDANTLKVNGMVLRKLGYQVITAQSGEAAVEIIKEKPVDLLVLDIVMHPGIDGVETYRRIKAVKPEQRAIVLSGYARPSQVAEVRQLGAGQYIIKPATATAIATAVRRELDRE
jgi:DNA-binding NtrC family response regulator